jgi:hypothetical protein
LKSLHIYFFYQKKFSNPRQGVGQITSKHLNQHTHTHTQRKSGFLYSFSINQDQIRFKSVLISSESSTDMYRVVTEFVSDYQKKKNTFYIEDGWEYYNEKSY